MGWALQGSPKTLRVTTRLAKEFAEMDAAHTDRPLSERRLRVYRKILEDGGFRPVAWAKAFCKETGQFYRVNGKHTSTLFSSVDSSKLADVYAVVESYECDTLEDVARLYATFDSQTQTRNATDINRSFAATIPELKDFDTRTLNLMVGALVYAEFPTLNGGPKEYAGSPKTAAERAERLFDAVEECVWFRSIVPSDAKVPFLWRVPVAAAMILTYRKSKKDATTFWTAVRDETGATPELPDRKLAKFLSSMSSNVGTHSHVPKRFRVLPREFFVKCIKSWNAWRKKEPTDLKYYADAKIPSLS
jgi:hypothetical protein